MADPVVWAPMRDWPAAFVPKTWRGMREWDENGSAPVPLAVLGRYVGERYEWCGARLRLVSFTDALKKLTPVTD